MRLAPILSKKGVRTTVLLPDEPGNAAEILQSAGIEVIQLPLGRLRASLNIGKHIHLMRHLPAQIRAIKEVIRSEQIDVVQINGLVNPHGAIAARCAGVPVVWQILDTFTPMALRYLMSPMLKRYTDAIMCTGELVAKSHPGATSRPERLVNFYPPVDLKYFTPSTDTRLSARLELGLPEDALVIGTVGNINRQKGHDNFIRAAAEVKAQVPDARFLILGAEHENHSKHINGLWSLANDLGLQLGRDLIAIDPSKRVHELEQAMDIFWMTSRPNSEGIPTAIEEAMALELPIVSFDVGSIGELVEHGRSGYLVPNQDPMEIAKYTLDQLLNHQTRDALGKQGRTFVKGHASAEICAEHHLHAYNIALNS